MGHAKGLSEDSSISLSVLRTTSGVIGSSFCCGLETERRGSAGGSCAFSITLILGLGLLVGGWAGAGDVGFGMIVFTVSFRMWF